MKKAANKNPALDQNKAIEQSVTEANTIIINLYKSTVDTYWHLGKIVGNLDTGYGKGAVKDFSTQLSAKLGHQNELSTSTLYRCLQFYRKYNAESKDKMIEAGISWTQVVETLPEDPVIVNEAVERIIEREVQPTQLSDTVRTMRETDGNPSQSKKQQDRDNQAQQQADLPTPDSLGSVKEFKRACVKIEGSILEVLEQTGTVFLLIDKFGQMDAEAKKAVSKDFMKIPEALRSIREPIGQVFESLQKLEEGNK